MNKKFIIGLVILMGISLAGITGVQIYWIKNAIQIRDDMFTRSVNDALNNAARVIENYQQMESINKCFFTNSLNMQDILKGNPDILNKLMATTYGAKGPSISVEIEAYPLIRPKSTPKQYNIENQSPIYQSPKTSESDTVISLTDNSMTLLDSTATVNIETNFNSQVEDMQKMLKSFMSSIMSWQKGRQLNPKLVKQILTEELHNQYIFLDFEFGIYKKDKLISKSSDKFEMKDNYMTTLFPNDLIRRGFKIGIDFPSKNDFIINSIKEMLLLSLLFSFIILITFGVSIYQIIRQKKISEMKSDFINNMTHEFKTPIATIGVAIDTLTNEKIISNPEQINFFAGMIKKENKRMNSHVEKILRIARLDRKDFALNLEKTDVQDIITKAVQSFELQIKQREGKIEYYPEADNPIVQTDPNQFVSVITNLLDNANKYSTEKPHIIVRTRNSKNGFVFSVQDFGIGMSRSVQTKIFERFYRQTTGNVHNVKGFGLGLSYLKAIIDANKGNISVTSEPNKGSTFEVFIPFEIE